MMNNVNTTRKTTVYKRDTDTTGEMIHYKGVMGTTREITHQNKDNDSWRGMNSLFVKGI